ncbi:MAG: GGDEF domain-containing protein [Treponema sp.]|nr:GGDEF domain-containing protein [Treponema sp.]
MEIDIYEEEQKIYDEAAARVLEIKNGAHFDFAEYAKLTKEYGGILKQLRRITRITDRTARGLHENNLDLTDKVHYDALTGIYNRRFMEDNLKRIIKTLSRSAGSELSVLMMDIDFFKKYNDTYGHSEGDICLKAIAETITECLLRPDDFVARYGGEEFVVILPNTDESGARVMANKILANIQAKNIPHEKNEVASCVTTSIGITTSEVKRGQEGSAYIKRADEALYVSKQNGRNRYTFIELKGEEV